MAFDIVMLLCSILCLGADGGITRAFELYTHLSRWLSLAKAWLCGSSWLLKFVGGDLCGSEEAKMASECIAKVEKELFDAGKQLPATPVLGDLNYQPPKKTKGKVPVSSSSTFAYVKLPPTDDESTDESDDEKVEFDASKVPEGFTDRFCYQFRKNVLRDPLCNFVPCDCTPELGVHTHQCATILAQIEQKQQQSLWETAKANGLRYGEEFQQQLTQLRDNAFTWDRRVVIACVCVLLCIAAHFWFKNVKVFKGKKKEGMSDKVKKSLGSKMGKLSTHSKKVAKSGKSSKKNGTGKKKNAWSSYSAGFDKITNMSQVDVVDQETGKVISIKAAQKASKINEIQKLVLSNPTKYKIRVDGGMYDVSKYDENRSFKMGNGKNAKRAEGDKASDQPKSSSKKKYDSIFDHLEEEKKPEGFFSGTPSKVKYDSKEGCCHNPLSCPLKKTKHGIPKITSSKCCGIRCGGHHCTHWAQCLGTNTFAVLGADDCSKIVEDFDWDVCNPDEEDVAVQKSFGAEGNPKSKSAKNAKRKVRFAKDDSEIKDRKVQEERKSFSAAVQAGMIKKEESLLGRKQTPVAGLHDSIKLIYDSHDRKPVIHGTFVGGKLVTVDHDILNGVVKYIQHDGVDYKLDFSTVKHLTKFEQGDLLAFDMPKGLMGVKSLKPRLPKKGENLILPVLLPVQAFSSGKYVSQDEHTCPSKNGDCGAGLMSEGDNACVGIHRAGGDSENGFFQWTTELIAELVPTIFQSPPRQ
jgi:hypothetical protein